MYDVIVIGSGPAGISSSLYAARSGLKVMVLNKGQSNLELAHKVDNYYGFENGISGKELFDKGIKQAQNLGVEIKNEEAVSIEFDDKEFKVKTPLGKYNTKTVIIATGNKKKKLNIKNLESYEGKGVSYCAICDAFFYKNKNVVVIGNGEFALDEARTLNNVASKVTILTDGLTPEFDSEEFEIRKEKIKDIGGTGKVEKVIFEDDSFIETEGVFVALGEAGAFDFAKTLGIETNESEIVVNKETMSTNVPGVFACGNITGGLYQISKCVYEGSLAGLSAGNYIRNKD